MSAQRLAESTLALPGMRAAGQERESKAGSSSSGSSQPAALEAQHRGQRPKHRSVLQQRAVQAANHPAGRVLLAGAVTWAALRGTIEVFHRSRRAFLRRLLFDLTAALERLGQPYWMDFGCLLGVHRYGAWEGDLILHDNDIDLAVLNPDWPGLLDGLRRTLPAKYSLKVVTPQDQPASSWIRVYCPLGMADLFGAYDNGGGQIYVDCGHGDTMHIDKELVLPPGRKEWRGRQLCVPADLEGTLAVRYGPTWRTPAYMDKGADTVEASKLHSKVFRLLSRMGIRI